MGRKVLTFVRTGNEESLKLQAMKIQEYCEINGYTIADAVHVVGNCALGQQLLKAALGNMREKGIEAVITITPNHIGRSIVEMQEMQEAFQEAGIVWESMDGAHRCLSLIGGLIASMENELPEDNEPEDLTPMFATDGMSMT